MTNKRKKLQAALKSDEKARKRAQTMLQHAFTKKERDAVFRVVHALAVEHLTHMLEHGYGNRFIDDAFTSQTLCALFGEDYYDVYEALRD